MTPAEQAIHDERQAKYGPWRDNMAGTSSQIDGLVQNYNATNPGEPLPEWFAPLVMCAVKLNRISSGNFHQDNFDDLRVYLSFVERTQRDASGGEK